MARPKADIDPRQVEAMASIGLSGEEIAAVIGCNRTTIYRRFATVLKEGHERRNASLRRTQYEVGVKGKNATMLIWLGKQYLGQRDEMHVEQSGKLTHEHRDQDEEGILAAADEIRERRRRLDALTRQPDALLPVDVS